MTTPHSSLPYARPPPISIPDRHHGGLTPPTFQSRPPSSPLRRKPLPQTASPLPLKTFPGDQDWAAAIDQAGGDASNHPSIDRLAVRAPLEHSDPSAAPVRTLPHPHKLDGGRFSEVDLSDGIATLHVTAVAAGPRLRQTATPPPLEKIVRHQDAQRGRARLIGRPSVDDRSRGRSSRKKETEEVDSRGEQRPAAMSSYPSQQPQDLTLQLDSHSRELSSTSDESVDSTTTSKPKSPGSKLPSLYTWKSPSRGPASSVTSYSNKSSSPIPSPGSPKPSLAFASSMSRTVPPAIDVTRANAASEMELSAERDFEVSAFDPEVLGKTDEMEMELREVSSELASSIRREMDLEDLVERLQSEASRASGPNKRTSDYFSDAGTSSLKHSLADSEMNEVELEKLQRKAEQEKAQLRLRLTQKVQDERLQRKALESQVRRLEERAQKLDLDRTPIGDPSGRIRQLENSLEETRRRLSEERRMKENYEDLLTALRAEIEEHRNERDNLRDEVVPQLRARLEGLESDSAESQRLTYEHTRMQQELQYLKNEHTALKHARSLQLDAEQPQQSAFRSIAEESPHDSPGLSRSDSIAGASNSRQARQRPLTRSNSLREPEARDPLADRVKDIEAQRDALHRALRSLLERQEHQSREHQKKMKALEAERDRAMSGSPRKGFNREVSNLREEINHLRRRADDALEQKWQCEKGLGGLKMDLDRAQQETSSLRTLLQEHDILVPQATESSASLLRRGDQATSASLENAYRELRSTHTLALTRIHALEGHDPAGSLLKNANTEAEQAMELLKKSISDAEAERDMAQIQAEEFRLQAESLQEAGKDQTEEEESLAGQLRASAIRVEDLAVQVRQQLESNNQLRHRLAEAITRGESQQKSSAARITEMQGKLKALEDQLTDAQQHSEETITKHEEEIRQIRESHNTQLQRMKNGFKAAGGSSSSARFSSTAGGGPMSPIFAARSPKLDLTSSGMGLSIAELSKADFLERRVEDLERALSDADKEMEEVVNRMNLAQIEVMELQSERDEAMRQTRKLQASILQERQKVHALII